MLPLALLPLVPLLVVQAPGAAAVTAPDEGWSWRLVPYLFASNLEGTLEAGGNEVETELGFGDLVQSLDAGGMLLFEGHRGRYGFALDGTYLELSEDGEGPGVREAELTVELLSAAFLYQPSEEAPLELALGARYAGLESDLTVGPNSTSSDDSVLDVIVGARSSWDLAESWQLGLYGDVGTGDSDLTWQSAVSVQRSFGACGVQLGYRILAYDFEDGATLYDVAMKGWQLGFEYRW